MERSGTSYLRNHFLPTMLLVCLGVILYANTINGDFIWDDKSYIVDSPYIKDFNNIYLVFQPWKFNDLPGGFVDITRPIMFLSLLIDYRLWGLNPNGYHATNIALHIIASFLVYFLSLNISLKRSIAFLGALLFLVHPVHVEVVAGMTFREDLLVTVFYLSSLVFFIKSVDKSHVKLRFLNYFLSLLFYAFALFSKEMAVTLPLVAFLYLLTIDKGFSDLKKVILTIFPFILITIPYLVWVAGTYSSLSVPPEHSGGGVFSALINIPPIIFYYVKLLFFPFNLSADPGYKLKGLWFNRDVIVSSLLLVITFFFFVKKGKKQPLYFFLFAFFLSTLLPVLQIFPTFNLVAERFLYLPSVGPAILAAYVLKGFLDGRMHITMIMMTLIFFSVLTFERNLVWQNAFTLWTDALSKNKQSYFAHINIANHYFEKKDYRKAENDFLEIIDQWSDMPESYNNLSIIYIENSLFAQAENILKRAISKKADTVETHMNLAVVLKELKRYDEAIVEAKAALGKGVWLTGGREFIADAYVRLGRLSLDKADYNRALDSFGQALAYGYRGFDIHVYLAQAYYATGNYKKSIEEYKKILSVNENYGNAYFFIGEALREMGQNKESLFYYRRYLLRWPNGSYSGRAKMIVHELREKYGNL